MNDDELASKSRKPDRPSKLIEPPPPDEWDKYADKVLNHNGKLPKNFTINHSPYKHRPRNPELMKKQARRAYALYVEKKSPKEIMGSEDIGAVQYENWWSQLNKDIDRYAEICFRSSIVLWMRETRSGGSAKIHDVEKAEQVVWTELRHHLGMPDEFSEEASQTVVRCLNKRYLDKLAPRHRPFPPARFASEFCKPR